MGLEHRLGNAVVSGMVHHLRGHTRAMHRVEASDIASHPGNVPVHIDDLGIPRHDLKLLTMSVQQQGSGLFGRASKKFVSFLKGKEKIKPSQVLSVGSKALGVAAMIPSPISAELGIAAGVAGSAGQVAQSYGSGYKLAGQGHGYGYTLAGSGCGSGYLLAGQGCGQFGSGIDQVGAGDNGVPTRRGSFVASVKKKATRVRKPRKRKARTRVKKEWWQKGKYRRKGKTQEAVIAKLRAAKTRTRTARAKRARKGLVPTKAFWMTPKEKLRYSRSKYGSKAEVYRGDAKQTRGKLRKKDLVMNKRGKVVSKRQHKAGKRAIKRLCGPSVDKALRRQRRAELHRPLGRPRPSGRSRGVRAAGAITKLRL